MFEGIYQRTDKYCDSCHKQTGPLLIYSSHGWEAEYAYVCQDCLANWVASLARADLNYDVPEQPRRFNIKDAMSNRVMVYAEQQILRAAHPTLVLGAFADKERDND